MANHDPRAIANEFLTRNGGPMQQKKLQKLVYIAHGWNLAISKAPLTAGTVEAWDGGPVYRAIWNHLRDRGYNPKDGLIHKPFGGSYKTDLSETERTIIDHVWKRYGGYSGLDLSRMTHRPDTPWSNAYFGKGRNTTLSESDIQEHFVNLARLIQRGQGLSVDFDRAGLSVRRRGGVGI